MLKAEPAPKPAEKAASDSTRESVPDRENGVAVRFGLATASVCPCGGQCPRCRSVLAETGTQTPGDRLPPRLQRDLGRQLGMNLSDVRVHHDERSNLAALGLGARAYTLGQDIVFSPGRYAPDSPEGLRLLKHELAHVAQQSSRASMGGNAALEQEADIFATQGKAPRSGAIRAPLLEPLSDAEISELSDEGSLDRLRRRLEESEREAGIFGHSPEYEARLNHEHYVHAAAISTHMRRTSTPAPTPRQRIAEGSAIISAQSLQSMSEHDLTHLWESTNHFLQANLSLQSTRGYQNMAALAGRISDEQQLRTAAASARQEDDARRQRQLREQFERDLAASQRTPGLLGLLLPAHTRPYYRSPVQEIQNPVLRQQTAVTTDAFYGAAHLGRDTLAVAMAVSGALLAGVYVAGYVLPATLTIAGEAALSTTAGTQIYLAIAMNPQTSLLVAEFGIGQVLTISSGGLGAYLASLTTPQGALNLLHGLLTIRCSMPGGSTRTGQGRIESRSGDQLRVRVTQPLVEAETPTALGPAVIPGRGTPVNTPAPHVEEPVIAPPTPRTVTMQPAATHLEEPAAAPATPRTLPADRGLADMGERPEPGTRTTPRSEYLARASAQRLQQRTAAGLPTGPGARAATTAPTAQLQNQPVAQAPAAGPATPLRPPAPQTAGQAAAQYSARWGGRVVNDAGLEGVFHRTRNQPTLSVDRRAAAAELRSIQGLLRDGYPGAGGTNIPVTRVRVLPPTSTQRSPDFVVELADGTMHRIEQRTFTAAPRGHTAPHAPLAQATAARSAPITQNDLENVILNKAATSSSRHSQLTVPLSLAPVGAPGPVIVPSGTAGATVVPPRGAIAINIQQATMSVANMDAAIANLAPRLGIHVQGIWITIQGTTYHFTRQGSTFVR